MHPKLLCRGAFTQFAGKPKAPCYGIRPPDTIRLDLPCLFCDTAALCRQPLAQRCQGGEQSYQCATFCKVSGYNAHTPRGTHSVNSEAEASPQQAALSKGGGPSHAGGHAGNSRRLCCPGKRQVWRLVRPPQTPTTDRARLDKPATARLAISASCTLWVRARHRPKPLAGPLEGRALSRPDSRVAATMERGPPRGMSLQPSFPPKTKERNKCQHQPAGAHRQYEVTLAFLLSRSAGSIGRLPQRLFFYAF